MAARARPGRSTWCPPPERRCGAQHSAPLAAARYTPGRPPPGPAGPGAGSVEAGGAAGSIQAARRTDRPSSDAGASAPSEGHGACPVASGDPWAGLAGSWDGEEGLDVAYSNSKGAIIETPHREHVELKPFGPVENGSQVLYGLDHRTAAWRADEEDPFHTQVGYWLWDGQAGKPQAGSVLREAVRAINGVHSCWRSGFSCANSALCARFRTRHVRTPTGMSPDQRGRTTYRASTTT